MTTSALSRIGIPTGTWQVDKAHTRVGFAVKSLGISTVRCEFREFDGAIEIGEVLSSPPRFVQRILFPPLSRFARR